MRRYPADALSLLNAVIVDQQWGPWSWGNAWIKSCKLTHSSDKMLVTND